MMVSTSKVSCYICGEFQYNPFVDELGNLRCRHCGCKSIVDFQQAVDILMEVYREGNMPDHVEEYLDEVVIE